MTHSALLVAALPAAVLLAACSDRDPAGAASEWRAERDTVGDTVVVRTVSGSVWGAPVRLVERMSIGVAEGSEEEMLGDVTGIAVGRDGSVYVVDRTPALRKYAPDGTLIRTFGRIGSGPGEYRRPDGGLATLPDGRVVLRDPGNGRLAVFSSDGAPLATWIISSSFNTSRKLYTDTAGNVYPMVLLAEAGDPDDWRMGLARFDSTGVLHDTIPAPRWAVKRAVIKGQREGNTSISEVPFSAELHWGFSRLGYMIGGVSSAYRIHLLRPGAPLRIERNAPPVPVQPEESSDERRIATDNMQRNFPGWVWNGPAVPDTKPPYRQLAAGDDGRIWVLLSQPGVKDSTAEGKSGTQARRFSTSPWSEPVVFDLFEPDGRYLGEVSAPDGMLVYPEPVFRGDTVWAAAEDSDGVRYVRRYEIDRAPPATR